MAIIDLNADLGEGGAFDGQLLDLVSSASIACGGHAGDDQSMERALFSAKTRGVRTGAHPGFVDAANFGRVELDLPHSTVAGQVVDQVHRISQIGQKIGQPISYVKLHGALYNMAARDAALAKPLFQSIKSAFGAMTIMVLEGSAQERVAIELGLPIMREGFADRAYARDGHLVPRSEPGAVLTDPQLVVAQAVEMARDGKITASDGTVLATRVQSICLHGDNAAALDLARAVSARLLAAGIEIGN